jgi:hypothetical protein
MTAYIRRYLLVHGAYMVAVLSLLAWYGLGPREALAHWDGAHYLQIARSGYVDKLTFYPDGKPTRMDIAFFPLYPMLMAALHTVTRLPLEAAGLVLSLAASLATAVGLGVLLEPLFGRRTALLTVTVWAVGVDAIIQSMLYAQPLIAAFAVWGAIAVNRKKLLLGALCAIGAGLSHSTGLGLIVVVMVGSALAIREAAGGKEWRAAYAPAAAFVIAPLGLIGYIGFLALRFHRLDTWFLAESAPGWTSNFDFGKYTVKTLLGQLNVSSWFGAVGKADFIASLWVLPSVGIMLWLLYDAGWWPGRLRRRSPSPSQSPEPPSPLPSLPQSPQPRLELPARPRVPWELTLFALVTLLATLTNSGPWNSKPRFLIPCLALCVPPAIWLAKLEHRPRAQQAIVVVIAAVSVLCCYYLDGPSPVAL